MTNFDDNLLKSLIQTITPHSPILAQLLDNPATAQHAIALLGKSLVNDAEAALGDILATAKGNSTETNLRIAEAEQQGHLRLRQATGDPSLSLSNLDPKTVSDLVVEQTKQDARIYDDLADARNRQITLHDQTNQMLAYGVSIAFFLLIILLVFFGNHLAATGVRDLLFTLLGVVGTGWANIIGYYFGSSSSSSQKSMAMQITANK